MIRVYIPKTAPQGGELRITIKVGRQGFTRTETLKAKNWKPKQEFYVDPDAISVSFSRKGHKHNWEETINLVPF